MFAGPGSRGWECRRMQLQLKTVCVWMEMISCVSWVSRETLTYFSFFLGDLEQGLFFSFRLQSSLSSHAFLHFFWPHRVWLSSPTHGERTYNYYYLFNRNQSNISHNENWIPSSENTSSKVNTNRDGQDHVIHVLRTCCYYLHFRTIVYDAKNECIMRTNINFTRRLSNLFYAINCIT